MTCPRCDSRSAPSLAGATANALGIGTAFVVLPLAVLAVYAASVWLTERRRAGVPGAAP